MHRMRQVQNRTAARLRASRNNNRFEEEATSILTTHAQRLDTHRRSVILFYLTFGLIAGFIIGIVGARGAFATPIEGEAEIALSIASEFPHDGILSRNLVDHEGTFDSFLTDGASVTAFADSGLQKEPERYAALLWSDQPVSPVMSDAMRAAGEREAAPMGERKASLMVLLLAVFTITVGLLATFFRHLSSAYAPRRRVRMGWPPRD